MGSTTGNWFRTESWILKYRHLDNSSGGHRIPIFSSSPWLLASETLGSPNLRPTYCRRQDRVDIYPYASYTYPGIQVRSKDLQAKTQLVLWIFILFKVTRWQHVSAYYFIYIIYLWPDDGLVIEAEACCHLVTLNKINIHNTSCVLACKSLLLTCIPG